MERLISCLECCLVSAVCLFFSFVYRGEHILEFASSVVTYIDVFCCENSFCLKKLFCGENGNQDI